MTYNVNGGSDQTIDVGSSGTAVLSTGNLINNTANPIDVTYSLVSVGYTNTTGCVQNVSGSAVVTVNPDATISDPGNKNQAVCINTAVSNISFALGGGAANATVTDLPPGMSG